MMHYDQFQANYPALTSWPKVNPSLALLRSVQHFVQFSGYFDLDFIGYYLLSSIIIL